MFRAATSYAAILIGLATLALWRGQDVNFDQRNYHFGIPALLLSHRFWRSIDPSGIQSYFNPYWTSLNYKLIRTLPPRTATVIMCAWQSLAFTLAGYVCVQVVRGTAAPSATAPAPASPATYLEALFGLLLCLAPVALSEAGTTFIDLSTSVLVIGAFAALLLRDRMPNPVIAGALAGTLIGGATGLKLTNAVFAFGVLGFVCAGRDGLRQRLILLLAFGGATLAGFVLTDAAWQYEVWRRFGNPLFPFYNNIFRSPDMALNAFHDSRFLPQSLLDIWRYPIEWLRLRPAAPPLLGSPSSEVPMRDPRWAIAIVGVTAYLVALLARPHWRRRELASPATGLLFAVVICYLLWLKMFGIHRYLAPADILCGAAILVLVHSLPAGTWRIWALGALAAFHLAFMVVPDWGHHAWRPVWSTLDLPDAKLPDAAIVFLASQPMTFLAADMAPHAAFAGVFGAFDLRRGAGNSLARQLESTVGSASGLPMLAIYLDSAPPSLQQTLSSYGLTVRQASCRRVVVAYQLYQICDVVKP